MHIGIIEDDQEGERRLKDYLTQIVCEHYPSEKSSLVILANNAKVPISQRKQK